MNVLKEVFADHADGNDNTLNIFQLVWYPHVYEYTNWFISAHIYYREHVWYHVFMITMWTHHITTTM